MSSSSTCIPCGRGAGGEGGSIWVSVAWGLAVLVVGVVSVVASASVLGLLTVAGVVCWCLPGQALSFCPDRCVCVCVCVCVCAIKGRRSWGLRSAYCTP